ncbi:MAG: response regulator transcription factor [Spirochaetaceae bacterium]|nr:response regulator transcription factor [Spirochaetaceae bacterium]
MLSVLVADDHFVVRKGLRQLLEENLRIRRLDEAEDGAAALQLARSSRYDLIILDYSMPGMDGLDLIRDFKDIDPDSHILVFTILPEEQYAVRAFKLGASGCANKSIDPGEFLEAVRTVLSGARSLSPKVRELLVESLSGEREIKPHERLSDREYQIFRLLAAGKSVSEIASILPLSVKTVSTYRTRLLEKMNMENNAQLMNYAFRHGLADESAGSSGRM